MGVLLSSLGTRCLNLWFRLSKWLPFRPWWTGGPYQNPPRDVEKGEGKAYGPTPKRRALLVGIEYHGSTSPIWTPLEGPHVDVDHFRNLLICTYGYSPEDIVVLKDDLSFSNRLQPTRASMIRELKRLVSGAAPGDRFTFLYSGHSDLQPSRRFYDFEDEEDGQDEVIITCDLRRIIDNELKYTLVKDLPVGCSLLSIFETRHSGSMLKLPHYHCNNVYVPWISNSDRWAEIRHNQNMRRHAVDLVGLPGSESWQSTLVARIGNPYWLRDTHSSSPLRINTEVGGRGVLSTNQCEMSVKAGPRGGTSILSPTLCESPTSYSGIKCNRWCSSRIKCDGWCRYDLIPRVSVVSLSARADLQRAWEGPRGSLTAVLCELLKKQPKPSYRTLMSHVNFQLHANARALHEYTLEEKGKAARGEGPGFDGELSNFRPPQLSSLSKLNMDDVLLL